MNPKLMKGNKMMENINNKKSLIRIFLYNQILLLIIVVFLIRDIRALTVEKDIEFFVTEIPNSDGGGGFEPHILAANGIDGNEWYYVDSPTGLASGQGGNLWISKDYGETWEYKDKDVAGTVGGSGDSYTAISESGVIYYTDLYLSTASVDSSIDGGESWIPNPFASDYVIVDRQWLAIGPTVGGNPGADDFTVYFAFNELASGLHIVMAQLTGTTGVAVDWVPGNGGLPITSDVGSRDNFAIDQDDGTIYFANYQSDGLYCYVSTNGASGFNSFTPYLVWDENVHAKVQNTFVIMAVDNSGNAYIMWSSRDNIYLGVSTDSGKTWNVHQVTQTPGTRVLPWVTAGDKGRVAMAYYDTPDEGNPNNLDEAVWDFKIVITEDALVEEPLFLVSNITPMAHVGSVRTSGLDGDDGPAPDRDLGDFICIHQDSKGRVIAAYGVDGDDGPNSRNAPCYFARQVEGPFLYENIGPIADFRYWTNKLIVNVDASASYDLEGGNISSYVWDWGDGQNGTGISSSHDYIDGGKYNITLKVFNSDGLAASITYEVSVRTSDEETSKVWIAGGTFIILIVILAAYLHKRRNNE